ncbi:hypothetical protein H6G41_32390 [Tolypothrix sp. FACHB-123]|uniref:hypothetical protein n=1 Tax=Tolypothrix sp. FACHB-123 TaxID=2692868 RepID=UPI001686CDAC|nr:hypothetical protein [Tolypothrix sp. FACHB-123]MBD2359231.1 hypothetical protein [Tolypothrix sp. FACHB-123]
MIAKGLRVVGLLVCSYWFVSVARQVCRCGDDWGSGWWVVGKGCGLVGDMWGSGVVG